MKSKHVSLALLFCIFILGFLLRTYNLQNVPTGFHRDEAFFGYNAFSLYKTLRDMSGNFLPLHLASFLYTPAGYSYFAIPFIALFGLSQFSIRFPSALFGSLTIIVTFFLGGELFSYLQNKSSKNYIFGFLSAFLLAISPWHINLSRTASAITLVAFFIALGVLFFLKSIRIKKIVLFIAAFFAFYISLFFYVAPYSFLPIFIPSLLFIFWKQLSKQMKIFGIILYTMLILLPLIATVISPKLSLRIQSLSIYNKPEIRLVVDEQIRGDGVAHIPILLTRIFHNKYQQNFAQISQNYFNHFSYDFLFTDQGLPNRYRIPLVGLLYLWELPFLLFGLFSLFIRRQEKASIILFAWFLFAPIGSALTFDDVPNLQRTMLTLPGLSFIVAYGIWKALEGIPKKLKKISIALLVIVAGYSLAFYLHQYYIHATIYRPWYRQDGYKELIVALNKYEKDYSHIVITNRESAPTIFFLFYNQYNPAVFQKETAGTTMHDLDRIAYGKFTFSQEECPVHLEKNADGREILTGEKVVLYVNSGLCDVSSRMFVYQTIKRHDNSKAFYILSIK